MKPTGNQNISTWLWGSASCPLQCCIGNQQIKTEPLVPTSASRLIECRPQACRNIKPEEKRWFFFYIYICFNTLCLLFSLVLSFSSSSSVHTNTIADLVFLKSFASRGSSSNVLKMLLVGTHTENKPTFTRYQTIFHIHNRIHKTTQFPWQHANSFSILSLCEGAAGESWRARLQRAQYSWVRELEKSLNSKPRLQFISLLFALKILRVCKKKYNTQRCWRKHFI